MKKYMGTVIILLALLPLTAFAQSPKNLRHEIDAILAHKKAVVGIAIEGSAGLDTLTIHGNGHFPMQSVFKLPIALAVLKDVDEGKLNLNQPIIITKADLNNKLYSPIRNKYPGGVSLKLCDILRYAVSQSDNVACDKLLNLVGGPGMVEKFLHQIGVKKVAIKYNEKDQQSKWNNQYKNWITPISATQTLKIFYTNKDHLLSGKCYNFLLNVLKNTTTGQNSIRGELPEGTVIAHKTGHSGTNADGVTAAVNDVGIVFLPDEKYFYLSIFVSNSTEKETVNQKIIADVAKAAWDYFLGKSEPGKVRKGL